MRFPKAHVLAAIPAVAFLYAASAPYFMFGMKPSPSIQLALFMLASPFAVLLAGHAYLCHVWQRHFLLALFNLPLLFAWQFALVAMWYLAPGLAGATVIGVVLCVLAAISLLVTVLIREPNT